MHVRHRFFATLLFFLFLSPGMTFSQSYAIKSNLLFDATSTLNLGMEMALGDKFSLEIAGNYNPWVFSSNRKIKHWLVQPELRYWFTQPFNRYFVGFHAFGSQFNMANISLLGLSRRRYQGFLYGAGFSYGRVWTLAPVWRLEATMGLGYSRIEYDEYECRTCGIRLDRGSVNYVGPTKLGLTLIYMVK